MDQVIQNSKVVRFAAFEVDLRGEELRKGGIKLKLSGQPFQVLAILLERPGEIVTRDELQKRLWPETFVDVDHSLNTAINKIREVLGDSAENPRFVETLPRRGYRFLAPIETARAAERPIGQFSKGLAVGLALAVAATLFLVLGAGKVRTLIFARPRAVEIRSIAVLPLENLSNDPGQDYFSDGITETLTTNLAQMGTIRVISRTSAMRFKASREKVTEIGRQLNVEAIVEGSVMREGNRVRVTAQLIDAQNDRHLWAKTYEREFWGVLSLQDEVARDIAAEIQVKVTPQQESRLAADRKTNPKAYDEYLRGRYLWGQRTNDSVTKAAEHFRRAIEDDPNFALAYSGLSDSLWVRWEAKVEERTDEYARKAIALRPDLAEGHVSLAAVDLFRFNAAEAEPELKLALQLNPNYAMAHHFYADYLLSVGKGEEALAENDRGRQLDPFSLPMNFMRMIILTGLRRYDQAIEQLGRVEEIAPDSWFAHVHRSRIYWLQRNAGAAIAEGKAMGRSAHSAKIEKDYNEVAGVYEKAGARAAEERLARLMAQNDDRNYELLFIALRYGALNDKANTLKQMERSLRAQESNLLLMARTAPEFDFLVGDPQFEALLHAAGVPQ